MRLMNVTMPSGSPRATRKKGRVADSWVQPCHTKSTARGATVANTVAGRSTAAMRLMGRPELVTHS